MLCFESEEKELTKQMATSQIAPKPEDLKLVASKSGLDLDSRQEVTLKKIGTDTPITSINDFVARMNNDSAAILKLVQNAYNEYANEQLAKNESVPWQLATTDEKGIETLAPWEGFILEGEKLKSFQLMVLQMAKLQFGYPDEKPPKGSPEAKLAWQKQKEDAKSQAQEMFLSSPATVAALKK